MKAWIYITPLLLSTSAFAGPEVQFGVGAGSLFTDDLEIAGTGFVLNPRVAVYPSKNVGFEADLGIFNGRTKEVGDFKFSSLMPRVSMVGRLWFGEPYDGKNANGDKVKKYVPTNFPLYPTLSLGIGAYQRTIDDGGALGEELKSPDVDLMLSSGPGLNLELGPVILRTDLHWLLSAGTENFRNRGDIFLNWEWTGGAMLRFGGNQWRVNDTDGDGLADADDSCPNEAEDVDGYMDEDGCPEVDNDGDKINDTVDKCPNEAEDMDGFQDEDGCPEVDNDEDGVLDADDACPVEKGSVAASGCPDQDEDGITDVLDECPTEKGPEPSFGCPDKDKDRVPDFRDECPTEAAPDRIDPKRSDGCPTRVFFTAEKLVITERVFFKTGRADIDRKSYGLLDDVAKTLLKYPDVKKVEVQGHTDNVGKDDLNTRLSQSRAEAVVAYLIKKGVETERLVGKGYGPTKPIASNDTEEGKAENRRVEFVILEQDSKLDEKAKAIREALGNRRGIKIIGPEGEIPAEPPAGDGAKSDAPKADEPKADDAKVEGKKASGKRPETVEQGTDAAKAKATETVEKAEAKATETVEKAEAKATETVEKAEATATETVKGVTAEGTRPVEAPKPK